MKYDDWLNSKSGAAVSRLWATSLLKTKVEFTPYAVFSIAPNGVWATLGNHEVRANASNTAIKWCQQHCQGEYKVITAYGLVFLESEDDAVQYKLTFSDHL